MKVSVIVTVFNEASSIHRLLDSLEIQTRLPDEIVIVDGGSTDGTIDVLKTWAESHPHPDRSDRAWLKVVVEPGANISRGRNAAIAAASGDVIASTDAGVVLTPDWLAKLVVPFEEQETLQVVSGTFVPDSHSVFEAAMAATVLPRVSEIDPERFLPSSRSVAFTRAAWEAVGGYPEWLDFCEDLIFDFRLRDRFFPFGWAPGAVVRFRPRGSLGSFFKQYYQYARGDGKADLWRKRHAIRYVSYLVVLPAVIALGFWLSPWCWLAGGCAAGVYLGTPYRRLWPLLENQSCADRIQAFLWVPIIRATGDIAKMIGYPVGLWWRLLRLPKQPELRWRELD